MKIIFFGTSDYCLPVLESLNLNFELVLVVTRPDKPIGRKKELTPSPTKLWAEAHKIPVITPSTLKKDTPDRLALIDAIKKVGPFQGPGEAPVDLAIVSDYGLIIPEKIFQMPKLGTLNVHFSKLPDLRGPSPVQFTLLRGDDKAWVTIFKLESPPELEIKMDSGPIIFQKSYPILPTDTTATLYTRLFIEAAKVLPKVISDDTKNSIKLLPQDHSRATFCKFLSRDDGFIEHSELESAGKEIYNKYRAYFPWPGLWTLKNGKRMKILTCHLDGGKLVLDKVQFEGKKPISEKEINWSP